MGNFSQQTGLGFGTLAPMGAKGVELDTNTMSARACFATSTLDRVGDVLNCAGIQTSHHQLNPVVLFNHGKEFALPIGKTIDPDGHYTVEIGDEEAYQTTYFSQSLLEAEQLYRLIEENVISANSIGYRPLKAKRMPAGEGIQKPGLYLEEVELLECSWVTVPANGEAVRAALSQDRICGKSISPMLKRAMQSTVAPLKSSIVRSGFHLGSNSMSKTNVGKSIPAKKSAKSAGRKDGDEVIAPAVEEPQVVDPVDTPMIPLGAEVLGTVHGQIIAMMDYVNNEMVRMESEPVIQMLTGMMEDGFTKLEAIEGLFAEQYPDLDPLPAVERPQAKDDEEVESDDKNDDDTDEKDDEEESSPGKSYSGKVKRFTKSQGSAVQECAEYLGEMSGAENLDKNQRVACKYYSRSLHEMIADVKDDSQSEEDELTPAEKRLVERRIKQLELRVAHEKRIARAKR